MTSTTTKRRSLLLVLSYLLLALLIAPANEAPAKDQTDEAALEQLAEEFEAHFNDQRGAEYQRAIASTSPAWTALHQDRDIQLMGFDDRGMPILYGTDNLNAAITTRAFQLHPGGLSGLNLTGALTMTLAVWDGGTVRGSHQEFGSRVFNQDTGPTHYHATHVAGTMIAAGLDPQARGMSYEGYLYAYDWNNDNSEMASAASNLGILASNHSYGPRAGWNYTNDEWYWLGDLGISDTEDYGFGFYDNTSRDWDLIAYNAPYYLICRSGGNERGQGPSPGTGHYVYQGGNWTWSTDVRQYDGGEDGFDCINWGKLGKNYLSVGAVNDVPYYYGPESVSMSSFSSWGPADDGRIKPDIVANGVNLYSTMDGGDQSYAELSGTSMSTPNFSGTLNLLIHYYQSTHDGQVARASTMKALVLHTADECGPDPGPDYMYGWGLMNALRAAELIQRDSLDVISMQELELADGEEHELLYDWDGETPIRATISWTDVPGTVSGAALNDRTPKLVNDLDLRLVHIDSGEIYEPWVLDPDAPGDAASHGDNIRDNTEQILIPEPLEGQYRLEVSHKNSLVQGPQPYSLVMDGLIWGGDPRQPVTNLTAEIDYEASAVNLTWELEPNEDFQLFHVYRDGEEVGTTTDLAFTDPLPDFGSYTYSVSSQWVQGESLNNPEVDIWFPEPVAPNHLSAEATPGDEEVALTLNWQHLRPANAVYDDGEMDNSIYLGTAVPSGAKVATRLTAREEGLLEAVSVFFTPSTTNGFGEVIVFIADTSDTPGIPGEVLLQSEVFVPEEEGWWSWELAEMMALEADQNLYLGVEWVETGYTEIGRDTDDPIDNRGVLSMDGVTWEPVAEALNGFFDGNPMMRGTIGSFEAIGELGMLHFQVLRDGSTVGETTNHIFEESLAPDQVYEYQVVAVYAQGQEASAPFTVDLTDLDRGEEALPLSYHIGEAYPNPFNPSVNVPVQLAGAGVIRYAVYDVLGRQVARQVMNGLGAGEHTVSWRAQDMASGVYFLRIQAGPLSEVRKVMLLR